MKKLRRIGLLLVLTLVVVGAVVLGFSPKAEAAAIGTIATGTCGENLTWKITYDRVSLYGKLTISGKGEMTNYYRNAPMENPWTNFEWKTMEPDNYLEEEMNMVWVQELVIEEGVTSIGSYAFWSLTGSYDFKKITLPSTLKSINDFAFYDWGPVMNCKELIMPEKLEYIGHYALAGFEWKTATLSKSIQKLGNCPFGTQLTDIYYEGTPSAWAAIEKYDGHSGLKNVTVHYAEEDVITRQPESVTVDSGETCQFTVATSRDVASYRWQYRRVWKWFDTGMDGYNTNTLTVPATGSRNGYGYRCLVKLKDGSVWESEAATLTVNTVIDITSQPSDQTVSAGYTGRFTVAAKGEGLKYRWYYMRPNAAQWQETSMTGYNQPTLYVAATAARNGYRYCCKITDAAGKECWSEPATLWVLAFTDHPEMQMVANGGYAYFSVETSVADGFTYQWQYRRSETGTWTNTSMTGYNTATLTVTATKTRNGYQYRCVITGAKNTKLNSKEATLYVGNPVTISSQPKNVTATAGQTVPFTVKAGEVYSYQWLYSKNGENWYTTSMEGAKTATLKVAATAARNGYQYRCLLVGLDGTETYTDAAVLTVK